MNANLKRLHPYPFERLAQLKKGLVPPGDRQHIALSIGEPGHATPHFIQEALLSHLHGLSRYPNTLGLHELRQAIAAWLARRFALPAKNIDPESQILPVNGTREALFSFAQCVLDSGEKPVVIMPNPFYQIYEGAALLAGAEPYYVNTLEENGYLPDFDAVPEAIWRRCRLVYLCSPGNPTGAVLDQTGHQRLLELAERYQFLIAADECYSEIYADEDNPPPGLLQSAHAMGNSAFRRCIVFHSLSKRSNAPGLRSGFVAGDAQVLRRYFQYRTYHGCAMPLPTQHASSAAWQDETHVRQNRQQYREKFTAVLDILDTVCSVSRPPASFYLWLKTPIADSEFARRLFAQENITVLPGSFLSRTSNGIDPGRHHVRIALVAPLQECREAANRIRNFINSLQD
ncbi:succinyldiaminopimelate transaminase [Thiolapillus sp.]|uniref:succinyldiaminopimelate transaminase n=1 Tax=Thiolapillus sp. TaxID=2017437 RepID=UPI003AF6A0C8